MTRTVRGLLAGRSRGMLVVSILVAAAVGAFALFRQSGGAGAQEVPQTATATRGSLVVSVGGVGRIVEAAPAVRVYPRASGQVSRVLASPGERVAAGEALAVLDDGGAAGAAVEQARSDVALARLELRQRQIARRVELSAARLDVRRAEADLEAALGGSRASRARAIVLAQQSVLLAERQLERLLAPPSAASVGAAEAELKRAEAALATLLAPAPGPLPEVVAAAQQAVVVARQNLARAQATGTPAEISAAQLELYRAQAELATLLRPAPAPLPEEVGAARAAVESARANLQRLFERPSAADVQAARLEVERAKADLRRLREGPSSTTLSSARQAVGSARARLAQARSRVEIDLARAKVEAARLRLQAAQEAQGLLTIRAPAGGRVTDMSVAPGAAVDLATPVATVSLLRGLAVTVDLSEFDVAQVRVGQRAAVSVDALGGETFRGAVLFVALAGTDATGVVTFPVQIGLREAEGVKPGMNVSVRIVVAQKGDVVQVPLEAVTYDEDDRALVTVVDEDSGQEETRLVTLGLSTNTHVEVVEGLEAGEEVALVAAEAAGEEEE